MRPSSCSADEAAPDPLRFVEQRFEAPSLVRKFTMQTRIATRPLSTVGRQPPVADEPVDDPALGPRSNRSAIGARVSSTAGRVTQVEEVRGGGSYISQNDLRVHFGLGGAARVERLEVRWPNGSWRSGATSRPTAS